MLQMTDTSKNNLPGSNLIFNRVGYLGQDKISGDFPIGDKNDIVLIFFWVSRGQILLTPTLKTLTICLSQVIMTPVNWGTLWISFSITSSFIGILWMSIFYDEALNLLMWFCGLLLRLKILEYCHQRGVRFGWHAKGFVRAGAKTSLVKYPSCSNAKKWLI